MNKTEFLNRLKEEGFNADFMNNGIPTVLVKEAEEIKKAVRSIKKLTKETGYDQSYGIMTEHENVA